MEEYFRTSTPRILDTSGLFFLNLLEFFSLFRKALEFNFLEDILLDFQNFRTFWRCLKTFFLNFQQVTLGPFRDASDISFEFQEWTFWHDSWRNGPFGIVPRDIGLQLRIKDNGYDFKTGKA
ncbi:hypothetical protein RclHR1_00130007 [Rhizophagus clarus]|uniref:Uncharacterized protein n=1 Tax=Rhizophagus clarus TaxID=94130 RepID=A0A2Z6R1J3_9GLOM|nr:hypothetical protein RclHR1_00130007 [Rhizophagus clarus]